MSIFHNFYNQLKESIFKNLAKDPKDSPLKVVIATVAMGMGADLWHKGMAVYIIKDGEVSNGSTGAE